MQYGLHLVVWGDECIGHICIYGAFGIVFERHRVFGLTLHFLGLAGEGMSKV